MKIFLFIGTTEIVVIGIIVLVLFGGKKVPELMRGFGKGIREFNDAKNEIKDSLFRPEKEQNELNEKK